MLLPSTTPYGLYGTGHLTDIGNTVALRGEQMKDGAIVPHIVGSGRQIDLCDVSVRVNWGISLSRSPDFAQCVRSRDALRSVNQRSVGYWKRGIQRKGALPPGPSIKTRNRYRRRACRTLFLVESSNSVGCVSSIGATGAGFGWHDEMDSRPEPVEKFALRTLCQGEHDPRCRGRQALEPHTNVVRRLGPQF